MRVKTVQMFASGLLASSALLAPPMTSASSLIGDQVTFNAYFIDVVNPVSTQNFAVGAGIECVGCETELVISTANVGDQTLDIGADYIEFRSPFETGFVLASIFEFVDLDWTPPTSLTGFSLTTDFLNVANSDVSFTGDSIRINLEGSGRGTFWRLGLSTVPEPGTLALLGLGLLGLGVTRRKLN